MPTGVEVRRGEDGRYLLAGELDLSNVEEVAEILRVELRAGSPPVVDLSHLSHMDSPGLRMFLQFAVYAQKEGLGPVALVNPSRSIRRLLEIALPGGAPGLRVLDGPV